MIVRRTLLQNMPHGVIIIARPSPEAREKLRGMRLVRNESDYLLLHESTGPVLVELGLTDIDYSDKALGVALEGQVPRQPGRDLRKQFKSNVPTTISADTPMLRRYLPEFDGHFRKSNDSVAQHMVLRREFMLMSPKHVALLPREEALFVISRVFRKTSEFDALMTRRGVREICYNTNIYLPVGLLELLNGVKCRYAILNFNILLSEARGHANLLVFDTSERVVYRFEPHGAGSKNIVLGIDVALRFELFFHLPEYTYLDPSFISERKDGPQNIAKRADQENYAIGGYCASWCSLFALIMATHPNYSVQQVYNAIGTDEATLCDIIHRFGSWMVRAMRAQKQVSRRLFNAMRWYREKFGQPPPARAFYFSSPAYEYYGYIGATPASGIGSLPADKREEFLQRSGADNVEQIIEFCEMAGKRSDIDDLNDGDGGKFYYPPDVLKYFGLTSSSHPKRKPQIQDDDILSKRIRVKQNVA